MTAKASRPRFAPVLALLALALLTHAGVRSAVMQAAMEAQPAGVCDMGGGMAGMPAPVAGKAGSAAPAKSAPTKSAPTRSAPACPYCAAAAHAPLDAQPIGWTPPAGPAVFARYDAPAARGPRGPPLRRPSARDPPSALPA